MDTFEESMFPIDCDIPLHRFETSEGTWREMLPPSPRCQDIVLAPGPTEAPSVLPPGCRIEIKESQETFVNAKKPGKFVTPSKKVLFSVELVGPDGNVVLQHEPFKLKVSLVYEDMQPIQKDSMLHAVATSPFKTTSKTEETMANGTCEFKLSIAIEAKVYTSYHDEKKFRFQVSAADDNSPTLVATSSAFIIVSKADRPAKKRVAQPSFAGTEELEHRLERLAKLVEEQKVHITGLQARVAELEGAQSKKPRAR